MCAPPNLLTTNAFKYAVATYDGTYGVIYLNGTNLVTTNLGSFTPQTSYNLYFGFRPAGGIAYYYGLLDELSLYKRALSGAEVNTLYLAGAASNSVCAGTPPTLSLQPVSQTLTAGNDAQPFTVGATGIGPFSYQWYYNGGVIDGAMGTALSLLNVPTNQSGNYSVIVSSSGGSTSSSNAVLTVTNAAAVARPANMVGWWLAEADALDSTTNQNNGVTNGNVTYVSGKGGQAFNLDGASGYVAIPASSDLNMGVNGTGLTIECWIKPNDVSNYHPWVEFNNGGAWGVHFWIYGNPQSFMLNVIDTGGTSHFVDAPADLLTTSDFQHVAGTYDTNSGVGTVYYNGRVVATNYLGHFTPQTTYNLYLGYRPNGPTYYNGLLDEVSIYSRALAPAEILGIYNASTAGKSNLPPAILTPPSSQTITAGNDALPFTVTASGSPPLSYQWKTNGVNISGATTTSYTALDVPISTNLYTVIVSNSPGSTTSATATLAATNAMAVADPASMLAWYQAEGNALDSTLDQYDGATVGSMTFVPGKVGHAFDFDGTSAYVVVTNVNGLLDNTSSGMTIECWIKPATLGAQPLVGWDLGPTNGTSLWMTNTQSLAFHFVSTSGSNIIVETLTNLLQTNSWQHVAATYDSTNGDAIIYYNGAVLTNAYVGTGMVPRTGQSYYNAYLGYQPSGGYYYEGLMDEVSIYSRTLNASEILGVYNASTAGKIPIAPDISPEPFSSTNQCGSTITLSVALDAGTPPFSYQWQLNGSNLVGATNSALDLPFLEPDQFGNYDVVVTNSGGTNTSTTATLTEVGPPLSIQGAVWLWGDNTFGESLTPGGLTNLAAVASGYAHTLALQQNGTVLAWGSNSNGQTNVPAGLTNVIAIAAGGYQSMALRSNGTVVAWGATYSTVPSALANVTAIAAGFNFSLALSNGFVIAWGTNDLGQLNVPTGLNNVVAIAAGGEHALALKANGTVVGWGSNGDGESTVPSTWTNVMAIAAGFWHSLALSNNGTVVAWGDNLEGQTNIPLGLTNVKSIAAGELSSLALEFSPLVQYYPLAAANDLLLIYNTTSTDSVTVLNYYLANRPLVTNANVLGLVTTNYPGVSAPDYETVIPTDFTNQIATPLIGWLNSNPTKRPQYVILFLNIPSRVSLWADSGANNFPYYQTGSVVPSVSMLNHSLLPGWSPFVTHINMTNVADCTNYISKLKTTGKLVSPGTLLLSASQAGYGSINYGNTNYIIDNVRSAGYATNDNLLSVIASSADCVGKFIRFGEAS